MSLWRFIQSLFSSTGAYARSDSGANQPKQPEVAATPSPDERAFCELTREVARCVGLKLSDPRAPWHDATMKGQRDGLNVCARLRYAAAVDGKAHALEVFIQGSIPKRLALQSRSALSFDNPIAEGPRRRAPEGVSIGDISFDSAFNLYSLNPVCRAALTESNRAALVTLAQVAEVRVANGEALVRQRIPAYAAVERVLNTLQAALTIAKGFSMVVWMDDTLPFPPRIASAISAGDIGWTMLEEVARGERTSPAPSMQDRAAALNALCESLPALRWRALLTALLTALAERPQGPDTSALLAQALTAARSRPMSEVLPCLLAVWRSPLCAPHLDLLAFKDAAAAQPATREQAAELAHLLAQKLGPDLTGSLALIDTQAAGGLAITSDPEGSPRCWPK